MLEKVEPYVTYGYGHDPISTTMFYFHDYFCITFAMLVSLAPPPGPPDMQKFTVNYILWKYIIFLKNLILLLT